MRIFSNPLVRLEFLRRFRSGAAAWGIPLIVLLPGIAVVIAYQAGTSIQTNEFGGQDNFAVAAESPNDGAVGAIIDAPPQPEQGVAIDQVDNFGAPMLIAMLVMAVGALMVLVPSVVGGSIASERDAQTLQPLQLTALTPGDIVAGKLVASMAYLLLLLLCLAPALTIPFLVGGVSLGGALKSFGVLLLICVELAAVALAVSAAQRRAVTANITSLIITGALMLGPFVVMGFAFLARSRDDAFQSDVSVLRLLGSLSPVSLFSWVGTIGSADTGEFAGTAGRVWSVVWWLLITIGALLVARRSVTAPTVRDR